MKTLMLLLILALAACATAQPPSTPQTQLAARIEHASTHNPCTPDQAVTADCLDDFGLVWSKCAWNSCGIDQSCRQLHQTRANDIDSNCGGPDWPACRPNGKVVH
jgi:hypothetical protein